MASLTSINASRKAESVEWQLRVDLAAAFRLAAEFGWHEAVANHFSLAVTGDGKQFLMNPRWRHFARVKASELQLLDAELNDAEAQGMRRTRPPGASTGTSTARCPRRAASSTATRRMRPPSPRSPIPSSSRSSRTPPGTIGASRSTGSSAASPTTRRKGGAWCA